MNLNIFVGILCFGTVLVFLSFTRPEDRDVTDAIALFIVIMLGAYSFATLP